MHLNSELLFKKYAREYFKPGMKVLEIGASSSAYRKAVDRGIQWDTLGLESSRYKRFTITSKDEYKYPIPDNTYDIVLSGQVLEHVPKIWTWIKEQARITKGYVITINPVSWEYHEAPVDCWRVYPEGMRALYEDAGLETILSKCESLDSEVVDTITIGKKL